MAKNNKYELRSREVQEVMNRPPGRFIIWGNTLIFVIIIGGIYLLNFISIPTKVKIPIKVLYVTDKVVLYKLSNINSNLKENQKIEIALDSYPENIYGKISATIASIKREQITINIDSNAINLTHNKHIVIMPSMTGYAEITTNYISLFSKLFDQMAIIQK